jgi:predicted nucleotidyltransferase
MKMEGQDAARAFVATHFPYCLAAVLFGSVARGEATAASDLDIIIVTHEDISPLAHNRKWVGERKWLYRSLQKLDHELADHVVEELKRFYQTGSKEGLIGIVVRVLDLAGGKLYEGYSRAG